jgi:outer membrane receptor for Fe3+-dicitrate
MFAVIITVFAVIALIIVNELARVSVSNAVFTVKSHKIEVNVFAQGQSIASVVKAVKDWTLVDTSTEPVVVKIDEYTLSNEIGTMTVYRVENATVVTQFGNRFVNTSALIITYTRLWDNQTVSYTEIGTTKNVEWYVRGKMLIDGGVQINNLHRGDLLKVVYN